MHVLHASTRLCRRVAQACSIGVQHRCVCRHIEVKQLQAWYLLVTCIDIGSPPQYSFGDPLVSVLTGYHQDGVSKLIPYVQRDSTIELQLQYNGIGHMQVCTLRTNMVNCYHGSFITHRTYQFFNGLNSPMPGVREDVFHLITQVTAARQNSRGHVCYTAQKWSQYEQQNPSITVSGKTDKDGISI